MESSERVTGTGHPLTRSDVEIPSTPPDHGTRRLVRNDKNRTWTLNDKKVMYEFYKPRPKDSSESIAGTRQPLTGSDVKIPSTLLGLGTRCRVQNGDKNRTRTHGLSIVINKGVMYDYNTAWTKERGFLKGMANDWKSRDKFNYTQNQLANKKKNISGKNLLMESGLKTMPDRVQGDSSKEESEDPPTENNGPQEVSHNSLKMESTENIDGTGHPKPEPDVEAPSVPPDKGTRCNGLNEGNNRTWTYNVNDYYKVMYELYNARPKEPTESIAGTGHPLTGSDVNIPDQGTRGCVQNGEKNRTWTHKDNTELMYCYYKARPKEIGFWNRMANEWKTRGNFDCSQKLLARHKKYILDKNLLTESELQAIRDKAQHDSLNEESEEPPTENDGPPKINYHSFKRESSESLAGTGDPLIGSDVEIHSTSPDLGPPRRRVRNGERNRAWTHKDNMEVMYCYYKARPMERGFRNRMAKEWKTRGNFDCTQQQLASREKYIRDKNLLTEFELQTIRDQVQLDSPNEELEEPPTGNDGPHNMSYHHFKMEFSESIAGTGDPLTGSDVEIPLAPLRDLGSRSHVQNGFRRWTHNDNMELMYCYYKARPMERGFLKRMANEWKTRGNSDRSQLQLASHKKYILNSNLLKEFELQAIQDRIQHDSTNEELEKPATGNDGPQEDPEQSAEEDPEQAAEDPEQSGEEDPEQAAAEDPDDSELVQNLFETQNHKEGGQFMFNFS